jgi:prepilin-type N-terminal cleavage/methylation domain-containing protein
MVIPPTIVGGIQGIRDRRAFTLLEVLLSAAIGVLLMAALYVAMNVQLDHAQAGREAVEQSLLVRAVLRRMSNDITPSLAAELPASNTGAGGAGGAAGAAGAGNTVSSNAPTFNLQGDSERLILWVSRISSDLSPLLTNQPVASDLRRVTYWMASSGGLARQEIKLATSDDALVTVPPNIPDEANLVIADEVQGVTFRYFDGTAWQDSWDGTASSSSGSPTGPPLAVEITLVIATPSSQTGDTSNLKTYRHVVAIPTANGASSAPSSTAQQ